jgi:adenosine deaminase
MSVDFIEALEQGDRDALRRAPKADLHTHGPFGASRASIAARLDRDIAPVEHPLRSMAEMHDWVGSHVGGLFKSPRNLRLGYAAVFDRARDDGLTRIEFGEDVWMITQGMGSAAELYARIQEVHQAEAPEIEWIPQLGLSRHCRLESLQAWIAPFLELGRHRTLDLSGDETAQPIEVFQPLYRAAKAAGLRLKAHVGEWGTADDVWRAVETLELDEVQHGIAAADSPRVMGFLAEHQIRLNICPTSNLLLGRVARLEQHPIRALFDAGIQVTVNTDDMLVFGASLCDEFIGLYRTGLFTAAELDQIRRWAL